MPFDYVEVDVLLMLYERFGSEEHRRILLIVVYMGFQEGRFLQAAAS